MSDGWTDTRQRPLINFLVYYPEGISFIKSVDALDIITDADTLCNLFGEIVEIVGPENVVHMVTGNGANYKAAGRKLTERYSTIKWSLCAVHCLNLVIKDIAEMPKVKDIATLASKITVFVYNHKWTLNWLRKRDGWTEIVRPGATHFATTFIALKSLHDHKNHLQALVVCDDFKKFLEMPKGKDVKQIVLDERFWNNSLILVRVMTPLICLMRICDSDEKPAIGYVYEGMHRARIGIKKLFKGKKQLYKPYTTVIKNRWDKMLRHSIHDAAYWLNPAFQYDKKNMCQKPEIMKSFLDMVDNQNLYNKQKVVQENIIYQTRKKYFSCDIALESCKTMRPDEWWRCFAYDVPSLQKFAMRILSQTASSSGCERIWSVFERIHTKKRNRLEHQRLTDLVYVHYNLRLQNRSIIEKRSYDPVDYESIDKTEFWIVEEEQEGELNIDELENMIDEYPNVNEEPISIPFEVNGDEPVIPDEDNDDDDIEINVDDED
ncbi:uncharacterized protein [Euphorbia lathyris]|uniref:uncharacterized protein n=1 Tax=Euphorbia lathyris TaxID=212925 RepID=UPI00331416EF